jgi:hypothetical protein
VTQKGDAKKDIQGAVFGLLIVMSAVLILTVINPDLTGFTFDQTQVAAPETTGLTVDTTNACRDAELCEVYPCESENCVSEIAACETDNNRVANRIPPNSIQCIGTDRSWNGLFGGATEQGILNIIGNRNIPCADTGDITTRCEVERNLCVNGTVFGGRVGKPRQPATIDGQLTIVCEPTLTEEERERLDDQVAENANMLATVIACRTEGQSGLGVATLGQYWWDEETNICRQLNSSMTTVSLEVDEDLLASDDYTRMAEELGRTAMLSNPENNERMSIVCRFYYGNGDRSISFERGGLIYQSESIGNIQYDSTSTACVFNDVRFKERSNELAPDGFQLQ